MSVLSVISHGEPKTSAIIHRECVTTIMATKWYKKKYKKSCIDSFVLRKKRSNTFVLNNILITRAKRSFKISIVQAGNLINVSFQRYTCTKYINKDLRICYHFFITNVYYKNFLLCIFFYERTLRDFLSVAYSTSRINGYDTFPLWF